MGDLHRATLNGKNGYYKPTTGELIFGKCIYSSIGSAIKYLK